MSNEGGLYSWEQMMACCFPCGFVWMKSGFGGMCCLNCCLGLFLGPCCVNICHACSYVGSPGEPGSPAYTIAESGNAKQQVIVYTQPTISAPPQMGKI